MDKLQVRTVICYTCGRSGHGNRSCPCGVDDNLNKRDRKEHQESGPWMTVTRRKSQSEALEFLVKHTARVEHSIVRILMRKDHDSLSPATLSETRSTEQSSQDMCRVNAQSHRPQPPPP